MGKAHTHASFLPPPSIPHWELFMEVWYQGGTKATFESIISEASSTLNVFNKKLETQ